MARASIQIAVPSTGLWDSDFGSCLAFLIAHLTSVPLSGYDEGCHVYLESTLGSLLPRSRERAIQSAIARKVDFLLFVDSDQTFPRDCVHVMRKRYKSVIAANIATKTVPSNPTARSYDKNVPWGVKVYTDPDSTGTEQVWRIGTGLMLINMSVFKNKKVKPPFFEVRWRVDANGEGNYVGEDWRFCEILEEAGIPIYIDHDVSKQVGHVGKLTFNHDLVGDVAYAKFEVQGAPEKSGAAEHDGPRAISSRGGLPDRVFAG